MTAAEEKQLDALIDKFLLEASDYCDSVRVFCTAHDSATEATETISDGRGNAYAQQAQVREWVIQQDEITRRNTPTADEAEEGPS
jgi:hypothetical protein